MAAFQPTQPQEPYSDAIAVPDTMGPWDEVTPRLVWGLLTAVDSGRPLTTGERQAIAELLSRIGIAVRLSEGRDDAAHLAGILNHVIGRSATKEI